MKTISKTTMKFKNLIAAVLPVVAIAGAVVGCTDYDNGYSERDLAYNKQFVDTYGEVDTEQDWNLAERASVTVTVAEPSQITIFALVNGTYSIVGEYTAVSATQELSFDVLEGTEDLIVTDGITAIHTTAGGSVSFTELISTRSANSGNNLTDKNGQSTSINVSASSYHSFTHDEALAYERVLPEIDDNTKTYDESNLNRATKNFKYVSKGRFSFHPVYWNTSAIDEIGIYFMDEQGYHEVPVYTIKSGDELQNVYADKEPANVGTGSISSAAEYTANPAAVSQQAREIFVDIPAGTVFGFYLHNQNDNRTFYSESEKNDVYGTRYSDHASEKACYAASVIIGGNKYLCFEDWYNGDFDLNDVVFKFIGNTPTVINEDPTAATWTVACEDLGGTFDWDFNDVVFKVSHISGQNTATITPLAAGGTLASYIFFENPQEPNSVEECIGEIHQLMGAEPEVSGKYTPINVYGLRGTAGESVTINVDEDWTMTHYSSESFNTSNQYSEHNMGGFSVRVLKKNTSAMPKTISVNTSAFGSASIVAAPNQGAAPQMVCLPYIYTLDNYSYLWAWSNEYQTLAYGENKGSYPRFAGWVTNHTTNTDWYKYPNGGTVEEYKWLTEPEPAEEPEDPEVVLEESTIGGVPSINWASIGRTVTGSQKFLVPSGQSLWMKLQINGEDYAGNGTFTATISDAGSGSTVEIWNKSESGTSWKELCIYTHGSDAATAKVTVTFSGDDSHKAATVTYIIMIPKKVHFTSHANNMDYGLKLADDGNLYMVGEDVNNDSQNWYLINPIDNHGNEVYPGYFWLCNAANKKIITISADQDTKAIEAGDAIPIGAQTAYFMRDSNGWISVYKYTTAFSFALVDYSNARVGMLDNRVAGNTSSIISFQIK